VLVSGYSGVGKSAVVNELHKVLVPPRGLYAAGKFDQYKRDIPYAPWRRLSIYWSVRFLVKSEGQVSHWRHALWSPGPNGQLIVNSNRRWSFINRESIRSSLPPAKRAEPSSWYSGASSAHLPGPTSLALFLDDWQWLTPQPRITGTPDYRSGRAP